MANGNHSQNRTKSSLFLALFELNNALDLLKFFVTGLMEKEPFLKLS